MENLSKHLAFVNQQIAYHERSLRKFKNDSHRFDIHRDVTRKLNELKRDMIEPERDGRKSPHSRARYALTPKDLEGLPDELIAQLNISAADREEFEILGIVEAAGGMLILDRILIALFVKRGELPQRRAVSARLYRMIQKGTLFGVPRRKGAYTIIPPSTDSTLAETDGKVASED